MESRFSQTTPSSMLDVETAVSRLSQSEDLIADGSGKFCLPTVKGQHPDLKSISADTVCNQCLISFFCVANGDTCVVLIHRIPQMILFQLPLDFLISYKVLFNKCIRNPRAFT